MDDTEIVKIKSAIKELRDHIRKDHGRDVIPLRGLDVVILHDNVYHGRQVSPEVVDLLLFAKANGAI